MFLVIGGVDVLQLVARHQRRRLLALEAIERLLDDAVLVALLRRQVEQHHRHVGVGEVGGNLRTHDASTENGRFIDHQFHC